MKSERKLKHRPGRNRHGTGIRSTRGTWEHKNHMSCNVRLMFTSTYLPLSRGEKPQEHINQAASFCYILLKKSYGICRCIFLFFSLQTCACIGKKRDDRGLEF